MSYIKNLRKVIISSANNLVGDNTIVAAGQLGAGIGSIRVWQVELNSTAANTITPKSNTTIVAGQIYHTANGSTTVLQNTETPWMETLPGQALVLNNTVGGATTGTLWYSLA
jgi:hypothetical protein